MGPEGWVGLDIVLPNDEKMCLSVQALMDNPKTEYDVVSGNFLYKVRMV